MSTSNRLISVFFTALPGLFFFILFVLSSLLSRDYWWGTYLAVFIVLLINSLLFGFALPTIFQKWRLRQPWIWILLQGSLAWFIALIALGLLNMTPLCIGQNNGDGNNNFGMCMFMTVLAGIVYTPIFLGMQTLSALIGHWVLSSKLKTEVHV